MKPYICNDPLKHDGELFEIGESIDLDDKQASPLLNAGIIRLDTEALLVSKLAGGQDADNIKPQNPAKQSKASGKKTATNEPIANQTGEQFGEKTGDDNTHSDGEQNEGGDGIATGENDKTE